MKKTCFKLVGMEAMRLLPVILLFFLIMTVILSLSLCLIHLAVQIPPAYFEYLDSMREVYVFDVSEFPVYNVEEITQRGDFSIVNGDGFTYNVPLYNEAGEQLPPVITEVLPNGIEIRYISGAAIKTGNTNNDYSLSLSDCFTQGTLWNSSDNEGIWINEYVAESLNVGIGDKIYIGENKALFVVKGVYFAPTNNEFSYYDFYIDIGRAQSFNVETLSTSVWFGQAKEVYSAYGSLSNAGFSVIIDNDVLSMLRGTETARVTLSVFAAILTASSICIYYSVLLIILQKRRGFIGITQLCGGGSAIVYVYLTLLMVLSIVALACASGLAVLFNHEFETLFAGLFGFDVTLEYIVFLPFAMLGLLLGICYASCVFMIKHSLRRKLAEKMRGEE